MNGKELFVLELEIPCFTVDAVANRVMELGIPGVEIEDETTPCRLRTYIEGEQRAHDAAAAMQDFLESLKELFPGKIEADIRLAPQNSEDWAHAWKKYFKPIEITERLVVKPTWEEYSGDGAHILIDIDPQMAFGTGGHDTTRLCLIALDKIAGPDKSGILGKKVLDVGCGTGVLAIAAAKLGAASVVGIDTDPIAAETSAENAKINKVDELCSFSSALIPELGEVDFDIITANIASDVLCNLAPEIASVQKPGGIIVLSGIYKGRAPEVVAAYLSNGYIELRLEKTAEWTVISGRRA